MSLRAPCRCNKNIDMARLSGLPTHEGGSTVAAVSLIRGHPSQYQPSPKIGVREGYRIADGLPNGAPVFAVPRGPPAPVGKLYPAALELSGSYIQQLMA
jgi:hypothetical protein